MKWKIWPKDWPKHPSEDCGVSMWEFFMIFCCVVMLAAPALAMFLLWLFPLPPLPR